MSPVPLLLLWVLLLAVVFSYPVFVLRPLISLSQKLDRPQIKKRFMTTDLLSLVFVVQLPLTLVNFLGADTREIGGVMFVFVVAAFAVWYIGLGCMNHVGVTAPLKRFVGIAFTFPAAMAGGFLLPVTVNAVVTAYGNWDGGESFLWRCLWAFLFCIVSIVNYKLARWIAKDSMLMQQQTQTQDKNVEPQTQT